LGGEVSCLAFGDRVAVDPNIACGFCAACRRGDVHLCERLQAIGVTLPGGMAPFVRVPELQAHKIPPNLSLDAAAFAEPLSCIVHGLERVRLPLGARVAVLGAGSIGLMMLQALRSSGAAWISVSEPAAPKRELAAFFGADEALEPVQFDAPSHESAYDLVVDCTGVPAMLNTALRLGRRGADILLFGVSPMGKTTAIEPYVLYRKEQRIVASNINPHTMDKAIALLANAEVRVDHIVSREVALDELPALLSTPAAADEIKAALRF
jgi:threonine dehydrogenase-like Zn-dependent dehydrogenase